MPTADIHPTVLELISERKTFRGKEQKLMREIKATRYAIDHTNAHVARLDWDADPCRSRPEDLPGNRADRAHAVEALAALRATLAHEEHALAVIRADERDANRAASQPAQRHEAQANYRERNREAIAAKARERRAKARQAIEDLLS